MVDIGVVMGEGSGARAVGDEEGVVIFSFFFKQIFLIYGLFNIYLLTNFINYQLLMYKRNY